MLTNTFYFLLLVRVTTFLMHTWWVQRSLTF